MTSITTINVAALWKGKKDSYFATQKGLRKCDPISPFIFILCMEKLTHLIMDEVEKGNWKGIKAKRNGPKVSHLMFIDDLLIFGKATKW